MDALSLATVTEAEIERAAALLRRVLSSPSPAEAVAASLHDLATLAPALLALNIRSARAEGQLELVHSLEQTFMDDGAGGPAAGETTSLAALEPVKPALRVHVIDATGDFPMPSNDLEPFGIRLNVAATLPQASDEPVDVLVIHNPQAQSELAHSLPDWTRSGVRLVVSLSVDPARLPAGHPDYARLGLGTRQQQTVYDLALRSAEAICVPSQAFADALVADGLPAWVMPAGWDARHPAWQKPAAPRATINIGWVGVNADLQELASIRRPLIRLLREFPEARLVIIGAPEAYNLFDALPEERRQYIPLVNADEHLGALALLDVLVVPRLDGVPARTASDARLVEAGARGLPWVASATPSHLDWEAGGLMARTVDEWHLALRRLVCEPALRATLGMAGYQRAEAREWRHIRPAWLTLLQAPAVLPQSSRQDLASPEPGAPPTALALVRPRLRPEIASYLFGASSHAVA
jgi:glycosyltransferase involved in cell wall biosynthesis